MKSQPSVSLHYKYLINSINLRSLADYYSLRSLLSANMSLKVYLVESTTSLQLQD